MPENIKKMEELQEQKELLREVIKNILSRAEQSKEVNYALTTDDIDMLKTSLNVTK